MRLPVICNCSKDVNSKELTSLIYHSKTKTCLTHRYPGNTTAPPVGLTIDVFGNWEGPHKVTLEAILLVRDALHFGTCVPAFRRHVLPPSSLWKPRSIFTDCCTALHSCEDKTPRRQVWKTIGPRIERTQISCRKPGIVTSVYITQTPHLHILISFLVSNIWLLPLVPKIWYQCTFTIPIM